MNITNRETRALKFVPRGLRRRDAADYVGVSPSKFDDLVTRRIMPQPKRVDGVVVWDRHDLDEAFEALADQSQTKRDAIWNQVAV